MARGVPYAISRVYLLCIRRSRKRERDGGETDKERKRERERERVSEREKTKLYELFVSIFKPIRLIFPCRVTHQNAFSDESSKDMALESRVCPQL
jgi:hypothetical protein